MKLLGFDTVGVRETTITNAGVLGNDQPLTSLTEYWHLPRLRSHGSQHDTTYSERQNPVWNVHTHQF
jgi:hypothetical protein